MNLSAIAGGIWVLAATITALLPMRRQYVPGLALLVVAPLLIGWLAIDHGAWIGLFALFAFLSMFRNPLRYLLKKALGRPVEAPPR